jgi:DNA-directed RNA polymerase subunit RPC12/RpoP
MPTTGRCSTCNVRLTIPSKLIGTGQPIRCPKCGGSVVFGAHEPPPVRRAPEVVPVNQPEPVYVQPEPVHVQPVASYEDRSSSAVVHNTVVVQNVTPFPHVLHLILTIMTCGMWSPIWLIHYLATR